MQYLVLMISNTDIRKVSFKGVDFENMKGKINNAIKKLQDSRSDVIRDIQMWHELTEANGDIYNFGAIAANNIVSGLKDIAQTRVTYLCNGL